MGHGCPWDWQITLAATLQHGLADVPRRVVLYPSELDVLRTVNALLNYMFGMAKNIGGGGTAHFGADDDGTETWADDAYHQRQESRSWHDAA
ncbi:hypothetical protein T492DRAFT_883243 [Pavlovales sp. CCMP2436]|nr:hypothetical protein T492DRAFT_883243 [Pavlovales sp. CCMP2436]